MKVIVVGSGVVGVASAWYLRRAGHEVTVLDRREGPALETSFANAGQVSWTYAAPWVGPEAPRHLLNWVLGRPTPLVMHLRTDADLWRWLAAAVPNCLPSRFARNRARILRLARYSYANLKTVRSEAGIHYDERALGTLQLFREAGALAHAAREVDALHALGVDCQVLDRAGCEAAEPALASARAPIAGGVRFPGDETGDCHKFAVALAAAARERGVAFEHGITVRAVNRDARRVSGLNTDRGMREADAYVFAAGSYTPGLLRGLGLRLPVFPVKGYSATLELRDPDAGPRSTLTDETFKVGITRLGDRLRAAGIAEFAGHDLQLPASRTARILRVVEDLFPGAAGIGEPTLWTGLRPMTPDNVPVIGATPFENLFLNTGHGTLGWTLSCGSGRVLADVVDGRAPEVDMEGFGLERF